MVLAHISTTLATNEYPRIRIGIGNSFRRGAQIDFVLGKWEPEEKKFMEGRISIVINMIRSFAFAGVELTMTAFNKEGKVLHPNQPWMLYEDFILTTNYTVNAQ